MNDAKKMLFEYVIIQREDEDVDDINEVIEGPAFVFAIDTQRARDIAMCRFGTSRADVQPEWVEVIVRPFAYNY